jgi:histone deacetylase complex regulatory component SIN3
LPRSPCTATSHLCHHLQNEILLMLHLKTPQVAQLFKSHSDLLEEFTYFLPDSTPPAQQVRPYAQQQQGQEGAIAQPCQH